MLKSNNNIKIKEEIENEKEVNISEEYHYFKWTLIYFRFKLSGERNNIQTYNCCLKDCKGFGELDLRKREFTIIKNHSIGIKDHEIFNKDSIINYMKIRNLKHLHLKKNVHNEKFHVKWVK